MGLFWPNPNPPDLQNQKPAQFFPSLLPFLHRHIHNQPNISLSWKNISDSNLMGMGTCHHFLVCMIQMLYAQKTHMPKEIKFKKGEESGEIGHVYFSKDTVLTTSLW